MTRENYDEGSHAEEKLDTDLPRRSVVRLDPAKRHSIVWLPVTIPAGRTLPAIVTHSTGAILHEVWQFTNSRENRSKSVGWHEKASLGLARLYDFFDATVSGPMHDGNVAKIVNDFLDTLAGGSVQPDGSDSTGLGWHSVSEERLAGTRHLVRKFCEFCNGEYGDREGFEKGKFATAIVASHKRETSAKYSRLYHLHARRKVPPPVRMGGLPGGQHGVPTVKAFPGSLVSRLIFEGCKREVPCREFKHPMSQAFSIQMMLALLLLAGGGLRKSELFHMFVDDVRDGEVRLYHPELGGALWKDAAGRLVRGNRTEFLARVHGLRPRTRYAKGVALFAGWKAMLPDYAGTEHYSRLQWISPELRELFLALHRIYVSDVRPRGGDHPYYFISLSQAEYGRPWTIGAFNQAFSEALSRIGEKPDRQRGLNPHGLRHRYGQLLVEMGISPLKIQQAMHHASILSQAVYTKPPPGTVQKALMEGAQRLGAGHPARQIDLGRLEDYAWRTDPHGLLSTFSMGTVT